MKFFNLFKKKNKKQDDQLLIDVIWQKWIKDDIPSPLFEFMTVVSNLGAGGHNDFFDFCNENQKINQCFIDTFDFFPEKIKNNILKAKEIYDNTPPSDRNDEFLDEYDDYFYENEGDIEEVIISLYRKIK